MVADAEDQKITYTTMTVDQAEAFNQRYDRALKQVMSQLGREYGAYIDNQEWTAQESTFESRSPGDTRLLLGTFQECRTPEVSAAVEAAQRAFKTWSHTSWQDRLKVMHRAANNFRRRKYEIAAWLTLEAGKPRLEAMGEVEEAADLISTYSSYMEEHDGFVITLNQLSPTEVNRSILRPYGVWGVVAPFNFPVALTTGMLAGVLITGNTAVFKPSPLTPLTGVLVYQCLRDSGLPSGAINYVSGLGDETGEAISSNPAVAGMAFTGSSLVGNHIFHEFTARGARPVIAEMGGKNPVIVTDSADLEKAVEGTARAAFGYSGQKCSAASRVYVQEGVAEEFIRRLVDRTGQLVVDNPVKPDAFVGPVISDRAYGRFQEVCERACRDGHVLTGGHTMVEGELRHGFYCAPTLATLPKVHEFFQRELFVPFLAIATVSSLSEALDLSNNNPFGLTAGIFSGDRTEIETFLDRIETGVAYVNRKGGATTGAWPGVQSFGGWKGSGSTSKNALGPYYIQQFMREQTQTVVTD